MKHDLEKLLSRLADEANGIGEQLAALDADADADELNQAALILRDCIANARGARNLIELVKIDKGCTVRIP